MVWYHNRIIPALIGSIASVLVVSMAFGAGETIVDPSNLCSAGAYVNDNDKHGLNVRSGPGTEYGVIGTINASKSEVEVQITGSTGKWVRIEGAQATEEVEVYTGKGWVSGPKLSVASRLATRRFEANHSDVAIYAKPDLKSSVLGTVPPEEHEFIVTGCIGEWLQVKFGNKEGWLEPGSYCGNPVTTCN